MNIEILSINYFELIVNIDGMPYILEYEARKSISLYNIQIMFHFLYTQGKQEVHTFPPNVVF